MRLEVAKYRLLILLFLVVAVNSMAADSTVVKYFSTDLTRGMVLDEPRDFKAVNGKSHFKAYYTAQGDLISVEYIPKRVRRGLKKKSVDPGQLELYREWYPWQRKLKAPIEGRPPAIRQYYGAQFNSKEQLRKVLCYDRTNQLIWTYHIRWNLAHTRSIYEVEAHQDQELTDLDRFLFVPELSEMRAGWKARFELRSDGLPRRTEISNELGQLMYYYEFGYGRDGSTRLIMVDRYRASGRLIGRHELYFKTGSKRPVQVVFYSPRRRIIKTVQYAWRPAEVLVTERDEEGRVSSKRVVAMGK